MGAPGRADSSSTYPVEACVQKREDRGLFMVARSAAKQKMWSLSRYKPGLQTLKHGERAVRQARRWLQDGPPDRHVVPGHTCHQGPRLLPPPSRCNKNKNRKEKTPVVSLKASPQVHMRGPLQVWASLEVGNSPLKGQGWYNAHRRHSCPLCHLHTF